MREHPAENEIFKDWLDGDNLFYRKTDKPHYLKAVSAVENDDKSLIVIGDEGVLDHYCRMLISRLKDNPLFKLEVFLSTSKDGLLKRFNQMLSNLSIDEARQPPTPNSAVQLLVINDAGAIKDQEWALLTRLIRDFPGANVRCAMFVDKTSSLELEGKIEKLGRKVHKWLVHAPTLDEVSELKSAGMALGKKLEVEKLLKLAGLYEEQKIEIRESKESDGIIDVDIESESLSDIDISNPSKPDSSIKNSADKSSNKMDGRSESNSYFLSLLLLLVISFGLMNFLYPNRLEDSILKIESGYKFLKSLVITQSFNDKKEVVEIEAPIVEPIINYPLSLELIELDDFLEIRITGNQLFDYNDYFIEELENTTIIIFPAFPINPDSSKLINVLEHPNINSIELKKEDEITKLYIEYSTKQNYGISNDGNSFILKFARPAIQAPVPEVIAPDDTLSDEISIDTSLDDKLVDESETDSDSEQTNQETSDAIQNEENKILQSSVDIIQSVPDTSVFLQHIVFADINQAITYIESYNGLEAALIVPISSGNRELIAVISGPFIDSQAAEKWSKSFGFGADYWIRSASSLKSVLISKIQN